MWSLIKRELKANSKSMLFWALGAFALAAVCFYEYTAVTGSTESMDSIFDMLPRIVRVMFGVGRLSIDEPEGYYACMMLWISLITFAHAAMLGGSLLSKEERDKTAEFLNTKPIRRRTILAGKVVAGIINVIFIYAVCLAAGILFFLPLVEGKDMMREVCLTMTGMLIGQLLCLAAGLCVSMVVKSHRKAVSASAFVMLAMYLAGVVMEMAEVDVFNFLTPFRAFNAVDVMDKGLELHYILITVCMTAVMGYVAVYRYERRNLQI